MKNISYHHHHEMGVNLVLSNPEQKQTYPWHIHTRHWTIGLLLGGHATLETKKGINRLQAGEHFIVPPHAAHHLILQSQSCLAALCLEHSKLHRLDSTKLDTLIRVQAFAPPLSETQLAELLLLAEKVCLIALSAKKPSKRNRRNPDPTHDRKTRGTLFHRGNGKTGQTQPLVFSAPLST